MNMILFDEARNVFHLKNEKFSYVLQVVRNRYLLHRYWGRPLTEFRDSAVIQEIDRGFSPQPAAWENERTFSLDVVPQEYPMNGHGDFRIPAYEVELENGTNVVELFYAGHKIYKGKPRLEGLPASYGSEEEAETLEVCLEDEICGLKAVLLYTIFAGQSVLARSVRFENNGSQVLMLRNASSMALDFPDHDFDRLSLYGGHAAERSLERIRLQRGVQETGSSRGASSHQQSPFLALARPDAGEMSGEVYGFSLIYSGSFIMRTEVEQFGTTRVTAGLNPEVFSWRLEKGEMFQTPEVVMVYGNGGLNSMSQAYHLFYRNHLLRGQHRTALRPILVNNWEATYFDFDEKKIEELADCAVDLGIELLVLDDGWFGKRNDDNSSLGDWFVNPEKLPAGIASLAEKVKSRGLKFGLWFEPEMVSEDSSLYRAHPDWILRVPDYPMSFGRHQLVLDLSRAEVRDYVVECVSDILSTASIDYVKWDMNRHMTEAFSLALPKERRMESQHRYMLGLYEVMERITQRFPEVLFESCSGGGGRFDAGILYYMPQTWTSDNTDAVCRLGIQSGTSLVFPPITMGAHVSVVPNHQLGRVTPMQMRAFVAMAGDFGYELDICKMSDEDKETVRRHTALYKKLRPTLQRGSFTRLMTPFDGNGNETAWMFQAEDGKQVVVMYFKVLAEPAHPIRYLKLAQLDPEAKYRVADYYPAQGLSHEFGGEVHRSLQGKAFYGDELMYAGLAVEKIDTDFAAYMWVLEKEA